MRDATAHGALWVCGPAGAGKTTVVAQWLRSSRRTTAWLRLDAADSDPGVLLPRLRDALAAHASDVAPTFAYGPEHRDQLARFARLFFRTLFSRLRKPLVWVLDNVQDVDAEVIDTLLDVAIDEAPELLTLIAISRSEPGARFARRIAHQQLTVLARDELKFSLDETAALFDKRALKLPSESIARCRDELDGWAVGLVFASDALRHDDRRAGASPPPSSASSAASATSLDAPALMNYLAADVFDHLPAAQQSLLRATAFLPRFTAAQAAQVSGDADSAVLLEQLHRHNGFVEIDAGAETYYRVHPVFRAFLQRRLGHGNAALSSTQSWQSQPSLQQLRLQSANLLRDVGQLTAAGALYAQGDQLDRLADMIEQEALALLRQGQDHTVVELVRMIPAASPVLQERPWLHFWLGEALALTTPTAARDAALSAERLFASVSGDAAALGRILAAGTLLSLHRAMRLDVQAPMAIAERCETDFLNHWQRVPGPLAIYAAAAYLSAVSTLNRGTQIPPEIMAWLLAALQRDGPANFRLRVAMILHEQFYIRNDLASARAVEVAANAICALPEARVAAQRMWLVGLSIGYVYQRRLPEADDVLERAAQLASELGDLESQCHVNAWRIIVRSRQRRAQEALPLLLSNEPDFARVQPLIRATLLWAEANLFIALKQYDAALARFDAAISLYHETNTNVEQGPMLWLGQSVCRLMLGRYDAALASLQPLLASGMGGMSRKRLDAFVLAIRAAVATTRRDVDAVALLREAFTALRETDYRDVMHGAESAVADLCAAALRHHIEPDFADTVIRHRQLEAPAGAPPNWPYAVRIACLGELQIETRDGDGNERAMRKSVELLQQVLAALPQPAPIDPLISKLWPGDGREGAQKAFDAALHRLRKRLGNDAALRLSERRLSLNQGVVHVDLLALQAMLDAGNPDTAGTGLSAHVGCATQVAALYRDHVLSAVHDDAVTAQRTRVWTQVRNALVRGIDAAKLAGEADVAAQLALRLQTLENALP